MRVTAQDEGGPRRMIGRRPPISGLPEIGTIARKSATADLRWLASRAPQGDGNDSGTGGDAYKAPCGALGCAWRGRQGKHIRDNKVAGRKRCFLRRPLPPLPDRPNPTDPGDAADLSTP